MQLNDPVNFFRYVTGFEPYKYQKKFLRCKSNRIAVRSGRQVGKTTMCAARILWEAFWHKNRQIIIIAPVRRQSKLLFQMIKDFIKNKPEIRKTIERETAFEMFFDCGSRIYCLTGATLSKDKTRGFSPNLLVIDEAAFVPDETFKSLKPSVIRTKGTIILTSTPYGKRGFFFEAFLPNSGYKTFHIKCEDCPHISKKDLAIERRKETTNRYLQEYEGEFIEEAGVYFPKSLILDAIEDVKQIDTPEPGRKYWLGVDCARRGLDETVYVVRDDKGEVKKILADSKQPSNIVTAKIKYLNDVFGFQNINIDDAGTGGAVFDFLFAEGYPVTPHKFSIVGKEKIYRNLKSLMENKRIKIPRNDKLIRQMESLSEEIITQGTKIQPPLGGHDDYPDALALAFKDMKIISEEEKKEEFFIY